MVTFHVFINHQWDIDGGGEGKSKFILAQNTEACVEILNASFSFTL